MQFLRGISSSAWPTFSSSSVFTSYVAICALMASLQIQCATAEEALSHKTSAEDQLQEILANERYFEYDEGLQDDNEEVDHLRDDGLLTKDELQDLQYAKNHYKNNNSTGPTIPATINGRTTVTVGNTYTFYSHDDFSLLRYPSNYMRYFDFVRGPSVESIEICCFYFRIERSYKCYKDRVVIYAPAPGPRKRYCGKRHGFTKVYDSDVWWVFITDDGTRKPGFCCEITGIPFPTTTVPTTTTTVSTTTTTAPLPCCQRTPTAPAVRKVVRSCADLLPGYSYCTCKNKTSGEICLSCSFCETCQLDFFAVHDFSQTKLCIYFEFPCPNCTMNLALNGFGYQQYVKGYVSCINPYKNVTLPKYPTNATILATFCPIGAFDFCSYFKSLTTGRGLYLENDHRKEIEHLAKSCNGSQHLLLLNQSANSLSTIVNPLLYSSVTIINNDCSIGTQGGIIDLTAFTNVESIKLELCGDCGDIKLNSSCLQNVTIDVPNSSNCNNCNVSNQATPPYPPTVKCQ